MFVEDFIEVDVPFEEVRRRLAEGAERWLAPLATEAAHHGEATVIALGVAEDPLFVEHDVAVVVDRPIGDGDVVAVPIRWQATGPVRLFPVMDGHLEACPVGCDGTATHLQFLGHYHPPGGSVGRVVDRIALHHLAEACVRSFLHRVGDGLLGVTTRAGPWPLPGP